MPARCARHNRSDGKARSLRHDRYRTGAWGSGAWVITADVLAEAISTVLTGKLQCALGVATVIGPMVGGLFALYRALRWHTEVKDGSAGHNTT